jgi:hypothetical protein
VPTLKAVYVPDSCYPESEAMDWGEGNLIDLCVWLESRFGPPHQTVENIYSEDADGAPTSRGYYVEQFEPVY